MLVRLWEGGVVNERIGEKMPLFSGSEPQVMLVDSCGRNRGGCLSGKLQRQIR